MPKKPYFSKVFILYFNNNFCVIIGPMDRIFKYTIEKEYEGYKLYTFLKEQGFSSQIITDLRKDTALTHINGLPALLNTFLKQGDQVEIYIIEHKLSEKLLPYDLLLDIVYEDEDIIVLNKPADMPIHPSQNNYDNSLANALAYYYRNEKSPFVFRCINRLDRDTSGLTVVAKNRVSAAVLSVQMLERKIHRSYYAVVQGIFAEKEGTIDKPIARVMESTIERCVDYENGERAITHYKVLAENNVISLVKCHLETGRTHQIRVHMKSEGHPLLGDFLYNPENHDINRQALHAGELGFIHPVTGEKLEFIAGFPTDFNSLLNTNGIICDIIQDGNVK